MPNPQMNNESAFISGTYSTPIKCQHCGGDAHLMRRQAVAGGVELRTFECNDCKTFIDQTVD
jgi:hypothetical protein